MIQKAVIIAAGQGSRLKGGYGIPKPLAKVAGVGLLKRTILSAKRAGIHEFVIVIGHRGDEIQQAISSDGQIDVEIEWVFNEAWEQGNGLSVLKAREYVDESFVLMMSDHLFDPHILVSLRNTSVAQAEAVLCVDSCLDEIYDMDDATKVNVDGDRIVEIGKELKSFNSVDTGLFLCQDSLFEALDRSISQGDGSLSGGIRILAEEGSMRTLDIEGLFWMDVDTPEALRHAENTLFGALGKETDGFVSRNLNRKISIRISSLLVRTPITPNQISIATMFITFLAAWKVSSAADYWSLAMGGILFQIASIVDGCDGEIAKLKFMGSQMGEWVDTIADNVSYFAFFVGIIYGMYQSSGDAYVLTLGWGAFAIGILAVSLICVYLRHVGSGSFVSFNLAFSKEVPEDQRGWFHRVSTYLKPWSRRDMFTALFCGLAILNSIEAMYWSFVGGTFMISASIFIYVGHMMQTRGAWTASVSAAVDAEKLVSEKAD